MSPRKSRKRKVRSRIPPYIRAWVYMQDSLACVYCGCNENLSLDHIAPVGTYLDLLPPHIINRGFNLVTACKECNGTRTNAMLLRYGRFLLHPVKLKVYRKHVVKDLQMMVHA